MNTTYWKNPSSSPFHKWWRDNDERLIDEAQPVIADEAWAAGVAAEKGRLAKGLGDGPERIRLEQRVDSLESDLTHARSELDYLRALAEEKTTAPAETQGRDSPERTARLLTLGQMIVDQQGTRVDLEKACEEWRSIVNSLASSA